MNLTGVNEWSTEEFAEKEAAMAAAPRRLSAVVQGAVGDEFQLVDLDVASQSSEIAFAVDAVNHILALLNFPSKLRPFLDCLIGMAGDAGTEVFTATNWEVARRARSGRGNCSDESMTKWTTRQKQAFLKWQGIKNVKLAHIKNGSFNVQTQRNEATEYALHINEVAIKVVWRAQSKKYWRKGAKWRKHQGRAMREAAREELLKLEKCPPLGLKIKTVSEEDKFDRRHRTVLTFLEKNRDALNRVGFAHEEYFSFIVSELKKVSSNEPGVVGNLLNAEKDLPNRYSSIWQKIKTGELTELIEQNVQNFETHGETFPIQGHGSDTAKPLKTNERDGGTNVYPEQEKEPENRTPKARYWANGGWIETSNSMTEKAAPEIVAEDSPEGDSDSEEIAEDEKRCAPYKKIVADWIADVHEKIPFSTSSQRFSEAGCWDVSWQMVTRAGRESDLQLADAIERAADNKVYLVELKEVFLDWVTMRLERWRSGVPVEIGTEKAAEFRERLSKHLKIPEASGDG